MWLCYQVSEFEQDFCDRCEGVTLNGEGQHPGSTIPTEREFHSGPADIGTVNHHVRFTPEGGYLPAYLECRQGPEASITRSFPRRGQVMAMAHTEWDA